MKLTTLLLIVALMQVSAKGFSQKINLNATNVPLEKVLHNIESQTGYVFFFDSKLVKQNVSVKVSDASITDALTACLKGSSLTFQIADKTIFIRKKKELVPAPNVAPVPVKVSGRVTDSLNKPLPGATVMNKNTQKAVLTNDNGEFTLDANAGDQIAVSFIGYNVYTFFVVDGMVGQNVVLYEGVSRLNEVVVSTGYQDIPKERVTGSFDQIDKTLINRSVSPNILNRLDGITSGLRFNGGIPSINVTGSSTNNLGINIRGQSTINATVNPLIVVDNFPYTGDINNINPNDIESVTILKDAAAASIWGASAANGVIVIKTKTGRLNQKLRVEFNSNVTITNKPDLFHNNNVLSSSDFIDVETYLFNQGYFNSDLTNTTSRPAISPVVNILAQQRAGTLSQANATSQLNALKQFDVRNDFENYFYQKAVNQQYSLGINGGGSDYTYALSVGRDNDQASLIRNGYSRTTVNSNNTYTPIKNLILSAGINYSQSTTLLNNIYKYGDPNAYNMGNNKYSALYPYAQMADANGNPLAISKGLNTSYIATTQTQGFLDWNFRPLQEVNNADNNTKINDLLLKVSALYKIIPQLNIQVQYQNEHQTVDTHNLQSQDTYYTRNLINQFSQYTPGSAMNYIFPLGGVLNSGTYDWNTNNLRGQLNYNQKFNKNTITAIAGAEIRQQKTDGYNSTFYGYNNDFGTAISNLNYNTFYNTNPSGSSLIPSPAVGTTETLYRYLSYFANAAYTYDDRYILYLSGRKDGSNIFGVKTNDKVTPLWSSGIGWVASKESFYNLRFLPYLKLRATYGFNGNVYQGSAYLTGNASTSNTTGANAIAITHAPNPQLRWERVKNINIGVDFGTKNNRLTGSIEIYQKNGNDLLETSPLAPQTGFTSVLANAATTKSNGTDVTIQSKNFTGKIKWNTTLLFSSLNDKLLKYDPTLTSLSIQTNGGFVGIVGKPLFGIFSYKWAGLNPVNGNPRGYLSGKVSEDYNSIINNYKADSLIYNGSARPTVFGSLRNDFSYKGFNLSVNIKYEFGYVFRRTSVSTNYSDILLNGGNADYDNRWQKPGDEVTTNVPSLVYPSNSTRNQFYTYSQALVQSGNNIRLQDIRLGYDLPRNLFKRNLFQQIQLYVYASNLGILWRENKYGLDPDNYAMFNYPNPFTISFGINANF